MASAGGGPGLGAPVQVGPGGGAEPFGLLGAGAGVGFHLGDAHFPVEILVPGQRSGQLQDAGIDDVQMLQHHVHRPVPAAVLQPGQPRRQHLPAALVRIQSGRQGQNLVRFGGDPAVQGRRGEAGPQGLQHGAGDLAFQPGQAGTGALQLDLITHGFVRGGEGHRMRCRRAGRKFGAMFRVLAPRYWPAGAALSAPGASGYNANPLRNLVCPVSLAILYVDAHLLVVDKPAGLLSVPGRGEDKQDCLTARVQAEFPDALAVHRLDMATSGLMLMARGKAMQSALSRLFEQRRMDKAYEAMLEGRLQAEAGFVELPLICDWPNRPRQMVSFEHGKPSLSEFRRLGLEGEASRVRLIPHTGRSHQLRVHMQAIGHPILGDEFYATPTGYAAAPRLLLHACHLAFAHPADGRALVFGSTVPF